MKVCVGRGGAVSQAGQARAPHGFLFPGEGSGAGGPHCNRRLAVIFLSLV